MAAEKLKGPLLVLSTAGSPREARRLARILLQERAAGCVSLVPRVDSWYWWQGKVEKGQEILLLIKTSRSRLDRLSRLLKTHHSYETPEIIALPIQWAERSYLDWLGQSIR